MGRAPLDARPILNFEPGQPRSMDALKGLVSVLLLSRWGFGEDARFQWCAGR